MAEPLRGDLEVVPDSRPQFTNERGREMARRKAEIRAERRDAVEEHLAKKVGQALTLLESQVDAAIAEQAVANLPGAEGPPDKDVMARGTKAAVEILDRVVGRPTNKVEGEITHNHLFEAMAQARAARG